MDEATKKRLKAQVRDQARKAALAAPPLAIPELEALFAVLDVELGANDCDHTRRLTQAWLERRGHDVETVLAWLDTQGGYCDCEVLANVEQNVDDGKKASRTPAN
jgi:hypothetical protein